MSDEKTIPVHTDGEQAKLNPCPLCAGQGVIDPKERKIQCPACDGTGLGPVHIPPPQRWPAKFPCPCCGAGLSVFAYVPADHECQTSTPIEQTTEKSEPDKTGA